jgi:hypothetical protein
MRAVAVASVFVASVGLAATAELQDSSGPSWVGSCADRLENLRLQLAEKEPLLKAAHVEHRSPTVRGPKGPVQAFIVELKAGDEAKKFFQVIISTRHDLLVRSFNLPVGWQDDSEKFSQGRTRTLLLKRFDESGYSAFIQATASSAQTREFARAARPAVEACLAAAAKEPLRDDPY